MNEEDKATDTAWEVVMRYTRLMEPGGETMAAAGEAGELPQYVSAHLLCAAHAMAMLPSEKDETTVNLFRRLVEHSRGGFIAHVAAETIRRAAAPPENGGID